ncbi:MAG: hypothetical protein V4550_11845 [Gemmatimonadota bacterium]
MSDLEFERRIAAALRAPVPTSQRAKAAIMDRIRTAASDGVRSRPLTFPVGRTTRHSIIGLALAAGIGSITTLSGIESAARQTRDVGVVTSVVIGDSVVDRVRDTLRLVRLIFDDSAAQQVAVVGDFNGWRSEANVMRRDPQSGKWSATLALHDGEHRYAIMVDNTRWAGEPRARAGAANQGYAILHVGRATN